MPSCPTACRAICPSTEIGSQKPIQLVRGDSPTLRFAIVTPAEEPFNLADYNVDFYIKRSMQDTADVFHGSLGAGVALAHELADGELDVTIPAAVTDILRYGRPYPWYLRLSHQIQLANIYIPARGSFLVELPAV